MLSILIPTLAQAKDSFGLYTGAGIGSSNFEDDNIFKDVTEPLYSDYNGNACKFILGYQINKYIALEGQYTSYADAQYKVGEPKHSQIDFEHSAISLTTNLGYNFSSGLRPFVLLGISDIKSKVKVTGSVSSNSDIGSSGDIGLGYRFGGGIEYIPHFLNGTSIRVAYEQDSFEVEYGNTPTKYKQSLDSYYVGIIQRF